MMILDEIQPVLVERENFWFPNYDVVPDIVVMGKGAWVAECPLVLYSFISQMDFVE
jgi:4-aminobutyrate aminotransferase-like enzyme